MNRVPDPLDGDERALAGLLARDALPGPSPQLDARILASARSATSASPSRRPRPRWIAGMSIAATLVLAIGIAWRLRPLPPQRQAASEAPQADMVRVVDSPARTAAPPPSAAADAVSAPMQPEAMPKALKPLPDERASAADAARTPAPEPPVVLDAPSPMDQAAPKAFAAPPPPPVPPAAAQAAEATAAGNVSAPAPTDAFEAARREKQAASSLDRVEVTGSRIGRQDAAAAADAAGEDGVSRAVLDEEPPATADSPLVQEAWLQRIRELLSAGEIDAARNSLAEFRRRYPKYALPEDLRSLAAP